MVDSSISNAPKRRPLVVLANTLPVRHVQTKEGEEQWVTSPGGLVSALHPIVRQAQGAWVGWLGPGAETQGTFVHEGITNVPVPITKSEIAGSYNGFCNRTLWPLYHDAVRQPEYHRDWWAAYISANERFTRMAAQTAGRGAIVWVHDYHLQLVPAMLRTVRPDVRIGFFCHIPFPSVDLFARIPWRRQLLEGLLGADVLGFQTKTGVLNFVRCVQRFTDGQRHEGDIHYHGRDIRTGAFPISIDFAKFDATARLSSVAARADQIRGELGPGRRILLGVDRLDYTKGIDKRLRAFQHLLATDRNARRQIVLVQVAVPSRERIAEYRELRRSVEELVGQINGRFGEVGKTPVQYLRRNLAFEELVAMYRVADVMLVTPYCDGMNLVAKEYAATRYDDTGALVLSEFTGAAAELRTALHVNPHDVDGMAEAMRRALDMRPAEATRRMRAMRKVVARHTVHDWANSFMRAMDAPDGSPADDDAADPLEERDDDARSARFRNVSSAASVADDVDR